MCSMPIDSRTMSSETPARASSSAFNWRWVVLAGWQARDLASPMLTSRTTSFKASMKRAPAALPPWMPKDRIAAGRPQVAPGQGVLGVVGEAGVFHPGHLRMLLQVAGYGEGVVAVALHAQRQGLQALRMRKALNGESAAPMLRSGTTRQRPMKAAGPKASV